MRPSDERQADAQRRHEALLRLLEILADSEGIAERISHRREELMSTVLECLACYLGCPLGRTRLVDPTGALSPPGAWYEERPGELRDFMGAVAAVDLPGEPEGAPERVPAARALAERALAALEPVQWLDIDHRSDFHARHAARDAGLRSAVAIALVGEGAPDAVVELFSRSSDSLHEESRSVLRWVAGAWRQALRRVHLERELHHREARYRALVDAAGDAIVSTDRRGRIESWNRAAERMFGYDADEVLGQPLTALLPETHREEHRRALERAARASTTQPTRDVVTVEGLGKDGHVFPVELTVATSTIGGARFFVAVLRDVTERTAVEEELRLVESATQHVRDAIVVSTAAGGRTGPSILYVNAAFSRMTGYSEGEALGKSFGLLAGPETDRGALRRVYERLARREPANVELTAYRKDGAGFLLEWHATPIPAPDGSVRYAVSIQRDVTEERRVEQALRRVDRDALTELVNRRVLEEALRHTLERSQREPGFRFALLFVDLDGFKAVNDEHGHVVGDRLLTAAARRLEHTIRPGDVLSRFGGDEFVILVGSTTDVADVTMVAERIGERLSTPFDVEGAELTVGASIGVALSDRGYETPEAMIAAADAAMYRAKRKGKGRMHFA